MTGLRKTVIGAVYPLASGVAQFNGAMVRGMTPSSPVDVISWRRMYPPLLHRGQTADPSSAVRDAPDGVVHARLARPADVAPGRGARGRRSGPTR